MPRRPLEKTKNARRKPRRFDSTGRFRPSRPFLQSKPVKENQETNVLIEDVGSRGDDIAKIQGYLTFVPRIRMGERIKVRVLSVDEEFALAERLV
jgi:23S rRNA (uridine2552-2'-O)-methyltransferase